MKNITSLKKKTISALAVIMTLTALTCPAFAEGTEELETAPVCEVPAVETPAAEEKEEKNTEADKPEAKEEKAEDEKKAENKTNPEGTKKELSTDIDDDAKSVNVNQSISTTTVNNTTVNVTINSKETTINNETVTKTVPVSARTVPTPALAKKTEPQKEPKPIVPTDAPRVIKDPVSETVSAGGSCTFTAKADNYTWVMWYFAKGNQTINAANASSTFTGLKVSGANTGVLTLSNIPSSLNGWAVNVVYGNGELKTSAKACNITVLSNGTKSSYTTNALSVNTTAKAATTKAAAANLSSVSVSPAAEVTEETAVTKTSTVNSEPTTIKVASASSEISSNEKNEKNTTDTFTVAAVIISVLTIVYAAVIFKDDIKRLLKVNGYSPRH